MNVLTLFALVSISLYPVDSEAVDSVAAAVVARLIQYDTVRYASLAADVTERPFDNWPIP